MCKDTQQHVIFAYGARCQLHGWLHPRALMGSSPRPIEAPSYRRRRLDNMCRKRLIGYSKMERPMQALPGSTSIGPATQCSLRTCRRNQQSGCRSISMAVLSHGQPLTMMSGMLVLLPSHVLPVHSAFCVVEPLMPALQRHRSCQRESVADL